MSAWLTALVLTGCALRGYDAVIDASDGTALEGGEDDPHGGGDGDGDDAGDGDLTQGGDGDGDGDGGDGDTVSGDGDGVGGDGDGDGDAFGDGYGDGDGDGGDSCTPDAQACQDGNLGRCDADGATVTLDDACPPADLTCAAERPVATCASGVDGREGCACSGGSCDAGLSCSAGLCLRLPAADWRFDGDTLDAGPGGYHGTLQGPSYNTVDGAQGVRLGGRTGYVDISPFAADFRAMRGEFTLVMRIHRSNDFSGGQQVLFSLGDDGDLAAANSMRFHLENGRLDMKTETGMGVDNPVDLTDAPPLGQWSQLAYVVRHDRVTVYVDGSCAVRRQFALFETQAAAMQIGGWPWASITFAGTIDRVRVYDRAMTGLEVSSLGI